MKKENNVNNKDYSFEELQEIAFNFALYKTGSYDLANEVVSQTMSLFILKNNTINIKNKKNWVLKTCNNFWLKAIYSKKRTQKIYNKYINNTLTRFQKYQPNENDNSEINSAFHESLKKLSEQELNTILFYYKCNNNISEMSKYIDVSYATLRQQISRIKRKIKAESLKQLGAFASKKVVTPQLNNLIRKFLNRFKTNLENKTLHKMYYYFSDKDLKNYNPDLEIDKIMDYDIRIIDSKYKVWVFYTDKNSNPESFYIEFFIDERNHLKIVTPPTKTKTFIRLKTNSDEGQKLLKLLNKYPESKTGIKNIPPELLEEIINNIKNKK